jgi:hypothetical protein
MNANLKYEHRMEYAAGSGSPGRRRPSEKMHSMLLESQIRELDTIIEAADLMQALESRGRKNSDEYRWARLRMMQAELRRESAARIESRCFTPAGRETR